MYIAIDIGKNVHSYAAYAGLDLHVVQAPVEVLSTRLGYEAFRAWLAGLLATERYGSVRIGLEPSGIYHESWVEALLADFSQQVELRQLNPNSVQQKRRQLHPGRQKKSDALDAEAIAHCLRDGLGYPARPRTAGALRFRLWATAIRQTQRALYRQRLQVLAQFDRLWPGALIKVTAFQKAHPRLPLPEPLVRTRPLERKLVQRLIQFRPNPHDWLPATPARIQTFFHAHHLACGPKLIARLQAVSGAPCSPTRRSPSCWPASCRPISTSISSWPSAWRSCRARRRNWCPLRRRRC